MKSQQFANLMFFSLLIATGTVSANAHIKIAGSIPAYVKLNQNSSGNTRALLAPAAGVAPSNAKQISLEKVVLSPEAKTFLANAADDQQPVTTFAAVAAVAPKLAPSASNGMNNVPVLDQGAHGTCVTFADTGAIDAAHGKTDYISQLCNLELGSYLEEKDSSYPSGWNGSSNEIVLNQIQKYGIVTMAAQTKYGCGDRKTKVKTYPLNDELNTGVEMSDTDFTAHSVSILQDIYWKVLLSDDDAFTAKANMDNVLNKVKQAIVKGNRAVFGTLLDDNGSLRYVNGAAGNFNGVENDSWVVNKQIRADLKAQNIKAGHAMVITGYDDNAEIDEVVGSKTIKHKGVLTLRNSWSKDAGDSGNYYMSYEYFKMLVMEVEEISPTPFTN